MIDLSTTNTDVQTTQINELGLNDTFRIYYKIEIVADDSQTTFIVV